MEYCVRFHSHLHLSTEFADTQLISKLHSTAHAHHTGVPITTVET